MYIRFINYYYAIELEDKEYLKGFSLLDNNKYERKNSIYIPKLVGTLPSYVLQNTKLNGIPITKTAEGNNVFFDNNLLINFNGDLIPNNQVNSYSGVLDGKTSSILLDDIVIPKPTDIILIKNSISDIITLSNSFDFIYNSELDKIVIVGYDI